MSLGKTIKKYRIEKGLKQKELAETVDVSTNYLSLVENDKREPSLSFLKSVSNVFGITVSELLLDFDSGEDKQSKPVKRDDDVLERIQNLAMEIEKLKILYESS